MPKRSTNRCVAQRVRRSRRAQLRSRCGQFWRRNDGPRHRRSGLGSPAAIGACEEMRDRHGTLGHQRRAIPAHVDVTVGTDRRFQLFQRLLQPVDHGGPCGVADCIEMIRASRSTRKFSRGRTLHLWVGTGTGPAVLREPSDTANPLDSLFTFCTYVRLPKRGGSHGQPAE